jgi:hypothetical protein
MNETGWLIESSAVTYWNGKSADSMTPDYNDAVRFARFEDAERVRCWLHPGGKLLRSTEHMWCDDKPPPNPPKPANPNIVG